MLAVGVDIGGTKIAAGVVDEDGRILAQDRRDTSPRDAAGINRSVVEIVDGFAESYEFEAIGIAAAGFVSSDRAHMVFGPNIAAWRDYPLADEVRTLLKRDATVIVENDANAAGWAEFVYGSGRETSTMIMLTIGTGLGAAMVIDGRLVRGAYGFAAELGHMRVVPNGHLCGCGHRGCWEQYASGSALVREARLVAMENPERTAGILAQSGGSADHLTGPHVTAAAVGGDALAINLLEELGTRIGEGCASLAAVLDPEIFIIGGGVIAAGDLVLEPARDAYQKALPAGGHRPIAPIVAAAMGNDAGIVGAASLARADGSAAG
ncbi:MAG: ROK family protein [Demequinaceae bacterium]|nr:ROK family protein [Demequinaceae bacterium]